MDLIELPRNIRYLMEYYFAFVLIRFRYFFLVTLPQISL